MVERMAFWFPTENARVHCVVVALGFLIASLDTVALRFGVMALPGWI
jgi:hypothetical protein